MFPLTQYFFFKAFCFLSALAMVNACSTMSPESFYEGVRSQDKAKNPMKDLAPTPTPNFQQYQQERERLKGAN
jgi:hypothetical protein